MDKIRVVLGDDHTLFRAGVRKLLDGIEDIEVVGEARDGGEVVRLAYSLHPDVVLMDISMPGGGGIEATRRIKERLSDVQVLVVTMYGNEEYIRQLLQVGSLGYVLKDAGPGDLVDAIRSVHRGEVYLGSSASEVVLSKYTQWATGGRRMDLGGPRLTHRQEEVLDLVRKGLSNKEIGDRLYISPRTVESHKQHIAGKLGLSSVRELTSSGIP